MLAAIPRAGVFPSHANRDLAPPDTIPDPLESSDDAASPSPALTRNRPRSQSIPPNQIDRYRSTESGPTSPSGDELGRPEIERPPSWYKADDIVGHRPAFKARKQPDVPSLPMQGFSPATPSGVPL